MSAAGGDGSSSSSSSRTTTRKRSQWPPKMEDMDYLDLPPIVSIHDSIMSKQNHDGSLSTNEHNTTRNGVTMLMHSNEWVKRGPFVSGEFLKHFSASSSGTNEKQQNGVILCHDLPAGSFMWVVDAASDKNDDSNTASTAKIQDLPLLPLVVQVIRSSDYEYLSSVPERFAPWTQLDVLHHKLFWASEDEDEEADEATTTTRRKRILIVEQQAAEESSYNPRHHQLLGKMVAELRQKDPELVICPTQHFEETTVLMERIHDTLVRIMSSSGATEESQSSEYYDAVIPVTKQDHYGWLFEHDDEDDGLMIELKEQKSSDGSSIVVFDKYKRGEGLCDLSDEIIGPAERQRLIRYSGDEILAVNGTPTTGKSLAEVNQMLREASSSSDGKKVVTIRLRERKIPELDGVVYLPDDKKPTLQHILPKIESQLNSGTLQFRLALKREQALSGFTASTLDGLLDAVVSCPTISTALNNSDHQASSEQVDETAILVLTKLVKLGKMDLVKAAAVAKGLVKAHWNGWWKCDCAPPAPCTTQTETPTPATRKKAHRSTITPENVSNDSEGRRKRKADSLADKENDSNKNYENAQILSKVKTRKVMKWSKEEDNKLIDAVRQQKSSEGNVDWESVAKLFPGRPADKIRRHYNDHLDPKHDRSPFSREDDRTLWKGHKKYGSRFGEIAKQCFGGRRTYIMVTKRWEHHDFKSFVNQEFGAEEYEAQYGEAYVPKGTKSKEWTDDEDLIVCNAIKSSKTAIKWSEIAKKLPGRVAHQVSSRWTNHLDPKVNRSIYFDPKENMMLWDAHRELGNNFAEISRRHFKGTRTGVQLKSHWGKTCFKEFVRERFGMFAHEMEEKRVK